MVLLTETEKKALLILTKEYTQYYNANSLSKKLDMSHVGVQKLLKRFKAQKIVYSKKLSNAIMYKPKLDEEYTGQLVTFILADEANNYVRWKEEFKNLNKKGRIILIYGSIINNYKTAKDIDILIIINKNETKEVQETIKIIEKMLPKKIHAITLTKEDLLHNLKEKNIATVDIIKNAIILYGQEQFVEVIKNVTSF